MFGFSFVNCKNYQKFNLPENNNFFEVAELSGSALNSDALKFRQFTNIHLQRMVESSVSQTITEHSDKLVKSFIIHFNKILHTVPRHVNSATFDFGIERGFENPAFRDKLVSFIKKLAPAIISAPFPILFPVRIPSHNCKEISQYASFLRRLVVCNTALSLDIHPHELAGQDFSPETFLRPLRFDIKLVRMIYEPETGNRLVSKVLSPWLEYLDKIEFNGDIIFCPASGDYEIFEHEYSYLKQLCNNLNRNS